MKKLMAIIAVAASLSAFAVETSIAYQGVLRNAQGTEAITGSKNITFALYTQATGGTPVWGRTVNAQLDSSGLFNVELADGNGSVLSGATHESLVDALKAARGGTLYVGLTVADSSGEIQPRQKILMTPYSSWAADVTNASGDFNVAGKATIKNAEVTGGLVVNGKTTLAGTVDFSQGATISGNLSVKNTGALSGYGTIPVGGIIMWSGSSVPDGWALCNGQTVNGVQTPNLVDRFIYGSNLVNVRGTGGSDKVTLSVNNLPSHNHLYAGDDMLDRINGNGYTTRVVGYPGNYDATSSASGSGAVYRTSDTGSGQSFSIMPPYYKLAFIMRVK